MATETTPSSPLPEAVERTSRVVDEAARQATTAIVFQQIAQSLAGAVQSSVDHLQSVFTLHVAVTGAAFARALEDSERLPELRATVEASQATVAAAIDDLTRLVAEAAKAMQQLSPAGAAATTKGRPRKKEA